MKLLTILFTSLLLTATADHDFHISKTNIRYVIDREQVQVEMHLFLDDLELALQEAGAPKLHIATPDELPQSPKHLARYLEKHFKIVWNGQDLPLGLLGYELSDDMEALWIYLAADTKAQPALINVQQSVLTEIYGDQRNIVKIFSGDASTTLMTSKEQPIAKYTFE